MIDLVDNLQGTTIVSTIKRNEAKSLLNAFILIGPRFAISIPNPIPVPSF